MLISKVHNSGTVVRQLKVAYFIWVTVGFLNNRQRNSISTAKQRSAYLLAYEFYQLEEQEVVICRKFWC